jgi:hypothetical protein
MVSAGITRSVAWAARMARPSGALVPSRRTTIGQGSSRLPRASTMPWATRSQRVIPPKMFTSTARTAGSRVSTSSASEMVSAPAPPPTSRKLAAAPPTSETTSRVDITSPAPLPMIPTDPSSLMKPRPFSRARRSMGSSVTARRKSSKSGWRKKALPSRATLASRATTSPAAVSTRGFTSTRSQSISTKAR